MADDEDLRRGSLFVEVVELVRALPIGANHRVQLLTRNGVLSEFLPRQGVKHLLKGQLDPRCRCESLPGHVTSLPKKADSDGASGVSRSSRFLARQLLLGRFQLVGNQFIQREPVPIEAVKPRGFAA